MKYVQDTCSWYNYLLEPKENSQIEELEEVIVKGEVDFSRMMLNIKKMQ
ncbi:MAG: hypothetical protein LBD17_06540 [Endomicrobium sp.]|jgi:hypothetical protein|nr:hypothetical protein [Endomicrobium sp.]